MPPRNDVQPQLTDWLQSDFGVRIVALEPVVGGLDPAAAVWSATDDDDTTWAVKWTRRDNRFGLLLAAGLTRDGVTGVPEQLTTVSGLPWSERADGRLSVSRWVIGREAFETGLDPDEWQALGRLLRRVHAEPPSTVPGVGAFPGVDIDVDIDAAAAAARRGIRRAGERLRRRLTRIDDAVALIEAGEGPSDPAVSRLVCEWPEIRRRIDDLRRAARSLKSARRPSGRVSCHGDPHLGNVLVDADGQPWLIDFDDAVFAPREVDLMLIELGVLFALPVSDLDREAFHRGYGDETLDQDRIVRFGCIRAVEDLANAALELLAGHPGSDTADSEALIAGILSDAGLAGRVERRLEQI